VKGRLGGLTGDVYGATIEIAETSALIVATLRVSILK
jgi:cobalamin synthase